MAPNHNRRNKPRLSLAILTVCTAVLAAVVGADGPAFARGGGGGGAGGPGAGGPGAGGPAGGTDAGAGPAGGGTAGGAGAGPAGGTAGGRPGAGQRGQAAPAGARASRGVRGGGGRGPDVSNEFVGLFASPDTVELAQQLGLEVEERSLSSLGLVISRFRAATPDQATAAQARLQQAERSRNALFAPNSVYRPMSRTCGDGGCTAAGLRRATRLSSACRQPSPIGIIDTEVERNHPALRSSAISVARFLPSAAATPAADGHGTAIAALLVGDPASRFPGMAPASRLYAANAFSLGPENDVRANAFNLAEALDWLVKSRPGVINLSLAGPPNLLLQTALARTADRGIVVVAAAGNGGPAAPPAYPAAYDRVIAVTAVDDQQRPYMWANQGDYVQFAAPGVELWTAGTGGSGERRTGTSFAAALFAGFVAGAAPLRAQRAEEVAAWARGHAVDLGPQGWDPVYGWGVIHMDDPCER